MTQKSSKTNGMEFGTTAKVQRNMLQNDPRNSSLIKSVVNTLLD